MESDPPPSKTAETVPPPSTLPAPPAEAPSAPPPDADADATGPHASASADGSTAAPSAHNRPPPPLVPPAPPPPWTFLFDDRSGDPRIAQAKDRLIAACNLFSAELATLGWDRYVVLDKSGAQTPPAGPQVVTIAVVREGSDPSAIAWHTEDADGRLEIEVGIAAVLDNGGGVLDGGTANDSVLAAILHEIGETIGDEHVNLWFDRFDGTEGARENSDPVQNAPVNRTYKDPHTGQTFSALVSNFVSKSWFDPQARTDGSVRFDLSGQVKAPCVLHSGYMVVRPTGDTQDVWGHQKKAKAALRAAGHNVQEVHGADGRVRWFVTSRDLPLWKIERAKRRVARRLAGHPGKIGPSP